MLIFTLVPILTLLFYIEHNSDNIVIFIASPSHLRGDPAHSQSIFPFPTSAYAHTHTHTHMHACTHAHTHAHGYTHAGMHTHVQPELSNIVYLFKLLLKATPPCSGLV